MMPDPTGIHVNSYYAASTNEVPNHPKLKDSIDSDVCVIGGGFTGVSSALHLAECGYDVVLLESNKIGWGASGRNGGQLGTGQRKGQDELEDMLGKTHARHLWELAEEAKQTARNLISRHDIQCDLKAGILHPSHKPALVKRAHEYVEKLHRDYNYTQARAVDTDEIRDMLGTTAYYGGWLDSGGGHLHPLNYALGLANAAHKAGVRIFEGTKVTKINKLEKPTLLTQLGQVKSESVIIGCNGYLKNLEPKIAGKIMPINNFILATEPLREETAHALIRDDVAVADTKFVINYYRLSADKRLLFGGGENYTQSFPKDIKGFVRNHMLKIYPQMASTRIDYAWGGTLAVTLNRMPHFGRLINDIYYAQGFSGHGVAMATLAGKLLAEAIDGNRERFDAFAQIPTPTFPGGRYLRWPGMVLGMLYYSLRDRL